MISFILLKKVCSAIPTHFRSVRKISSPSLVATTVSPSILDSIDETVGNVLRDLGDSSDLLGLPAGPQRETLSIARHLRKKRQSVQCRRCWMHQTLCYCETIPPLQTGLALDRIFVLMHHKEVGMAIDTSKIIFAAFPEKALAVIGGIPSSYQRSMREMLLAIELQQAAVLFPGNDEVPTASEIARKDNTGDKRAIRSLILIDGTWEQARRLHARYTKSPTSSSPPPLQVQLSSTISDTLDAEGRQSRPHPIAAREIATAHALEVFLLESAWATPATVDALRMYQVATHQAIHLAKQQKRRGKPLHFKNG